MKNVVFHQQRPFFDNRKDISKIVVLKIQMVAICISASSTHRLFSFLKNKKYLNFWWYFKVLQASCLWANFGSFGQFWEDSAALLVVECMPLNGVKTLKPHNP
jgi:hypothetical protein